MDWQSISCEFDSEDERGRTALFISACLFVFLWFLFLAADSSWSSDGVKERIEEYASKALEAGKTIRNPYNKAEALGRVAGVRVRMGEYDKALEAVEEIEEPYRKTVALIALSGQAAGQGERQQAERFRSMALKTAGTVGEPEWKATAVVAVALSYAGQGLPDQTGKLLTEAEEIVEGVEDTQWKADLYADLGKAHLEHGEKDKGLELLEVAFEHAKTLEDAYDSNASPGDDRISVMDKIAETYADVGEPERAQQVRKAIAETSTKTAEKNRIIRIQLAARNYDEAVETAETIENKHTKTHTLNGIGTHAWDCGLSSLALPVFDKAAETAKEIENKHVQAKALGPVAISYAKADQLEKARETVDAVEDKAVRDLTLSRIAGIYTDAGNFAEAEKCMAKIETPFYRSFALNSISGAYLGAGDMAQAEKNLAGAMESAEDMPDSYRKSEMYSRLAIRYAQIERYEKALGIADSIEDDYHRATALYWTSYYAGAKGDFARAQSVAEIIEDPYYRASAFVWLAEKELDSIPTRQPSKTGGLS